MNRIVFLGTGAGDVTMITQEINTSSIYCELDELKFLIDPGPGTLVNAKKYGINLLELNGVLLSHPHPDHYTDANVIITVFDKEGTFLIAEETCLKGNQDFFPCVSKFHQSRPSKVFPMKPNDTVEVSGLKITAIKAKHYSPCIGFLIEGTKKISYAADGIYTEENCKKFKNSDILILNTFIPFKSEAASEYYFMQKHGVLHMSVEDAIEIVKIAKPKLAIIQHFSKKFLEANPEKQAEIIEKTTGVRTVAAKDGMEINLGEI
jgi:ribonuclease BN (tRNA processing enzyme)